MAEVALDRDLVPQLPQLQLHIIAVRRFFREDLGGDGMAGFNSPQLVTSRERSLAKASDAPVNPVWRVPPICYFHVL